MKKAKKIIAMVIILIGIAGFIPIPRFYKDGYWERTDFYLFPKNLESHGFFEP